MKPQLFIATLLALVSSISLADSAAREALIDRIETLYIATAMVSPESPVMSSVLQPAMSVNPGVSPETWRTVRVETAAAMTKMFTEKGSTMDVLIRASLDSFSDKELKALGQLLNDPAFRKFQAAMSGPAAQQQLHAGMTKAGLQLGPLINSILVKHQLIEVH